MPKIITTPALKKLARHAKGAGFERQLNPRVLANLDPHARHVVYSAYLRDDCVRAALFVWLCSGESVHAWLDVGNDEYTQLTEGGAP